MGPEPSPKWIKGYLVILLYHIYHFLDSYYFAWCRFFFELTKVLIKKCLKTSIFLPDCFLDFPTGWVDRCRVVRLRFIRTRGFLRTCGFLQDPGGFLGSLRDLRAWVPVRPRLGSVEPNLAVVHKVYKKMTLTSLLGRYRVF